MKKCCRLIEIGDFGKTQLALAKSYRLVAAQLRVTGNLAAAFQNAQEAVSICERLRDAHPEDKKVLAELRTAYDRIGHIPAGKLEPGIIRAIPSCRA